MKDLHRGSPEGAGRGVGKRVGVTKGWWGEKEGEGGGVKREQ